MLIIITIIGVVYFFLSVIRAPKQSGGQEVQRSKENQQVALESNAYLEIYSITVSLNPSSSQRECLRLDLSLR